MSKGTVMGIATDGLRRRAPRLLALFLCATPAGARAVDPGGGTAFLNGTGGVAYGVSDGNAFRSDGLDAPAAGNLRKLEPDLISTFKPVARTPVAVQIEGKGRKDVDHERGAAEYGFAADELKVRVGKVRLPIGISAEVADTGTSRRFHSLPISLYGVSGIAHEACFGGEMEVETVEPCLRLCRPLVASLFSPEEARIIGLVGARMIVGLPLDGLNARLFGHHGNPENCGSDVAGVASLPHEDERWSARAEGFATPEREPALGGDAEVAFRIAGHCQVAGRIDAMRTGAPGIPSDSSLLRDRALEPGLKDWSSPPMVVRLAVHDVVENRLVVPDHLDDALLANNLELRTRAFTAGTQFTI